MPHTAFVALFFLRGIYYSLPPHNLAIQHKPFLRA